MGYVFSGGFARDRNMDKIILDERFKAAPGEGTAVCIGKFDGLHLGHMRLLEQLLAYREKGLKTVLLSFDKSLLSFFGMENPGLLTSDEEKEELLAGTGIDHYVIYPVNEASMGIDPRSFIEDVLCEKLNAKAVVSGPDLSFGRGGKGDITLLNEESKRLGYEPVCIPKLCIDDEDGVGQTVSSSYIRSLIQKGRLQQAAKVLGRYYGFRGQVQKGKELGRTLGFPTANMFPEENKVIPAHGVYLSYVEYKGKRHSALTNIGTNPTVNGKQVMIESYIKDFDDNIYGRDIKVFLRSYVRGEIRFDSVEALKAQLESDKRLLDE